MLWLLADCLPFFSEWGFVNCLHYLSLFTSVFLPISSLRLVIGTKDALRVSIIPVISERENRKIDKWSNLVGRSFFLFLGV